MLVRRVFAEVLVLQPQLVLEAREHALTDLVEGFGFIEHMLSRTLFSSGDGVCGLYVSVCARMEDWGILELRVRVCVCVCARR